MAKKKILYAAHNSYDAKTRLHRFIQNSNDFEIKIAAYKKSLIPGLTNYVLDSLVNLYDSNIINYSGDALQNYYDFIKKYNPDLIISDFDPYTSYVANVLQKEIWQVSPNLLIHGLSLKEKQKLSIRNDFFIHVKHLDTSSGYSVLNILNNADRKLIYSPFGDLTNSPELSSGFEWVRPYYLSFNESKACHHNLVAAFPVNNKKHLSFLKNYEDTVVFSNFINEYYKNIKLKNISNEIEYICNLKNCNMFFNQGHTCQISDAFYNKKFSYIYQDFNDLECLSNSKTADFYGIGKILYDGLFEYNNKDIVYDMKDNIKFLKEII